MQQKRQCRHLDRARKEVDGVEIRAILSESKALSIDCQAADHAGAGSEGGSRDRHGRVGAAEAEQEAGCRPA